MSSEALDKFMEILKDEKTMSSLTMASAGIANGFNDTAKAFQNFGDAVDKLNQPEPKKKEVEDPLFGSW